MPVEIQPLHLVIVAIVALIVFGPSRLPEIGRGLGRAINEFRRGTQEMAESFRAEVSAASRPGQVPKVISAPAPDGETECPGCGGRNAAVARFCAHCGARLTHGQNDS